VRTEAERLERLAAALELVALVERSFPSARFTDEHRQAYAADVAHLDPAEAAAAVEVIKRQPGRDFAPTAGAVCHEVARLQLDAPDWGEVKRQLVNRHVATIASRDEPESWECPAGRCDGTGFVDVSTPELPNTVTDCECRPARTAKRQGADHLHPLVREFVRDGYVTWAELDAVGSGDGKDASTREAQMRDKWQAFARRAVESRAIAALDAPPSMRRLEQARAEDDRPTRRELGRPDFLAALPQAS
jgi:hypothetical protein